MILLTSEDGHELRRNSEDTLTGDTCEDSFDYGFGEGAQAQLKKCMEDIEEILDEDDLRLALCYKLNNIHNELEGI